tara:strand:- start:478 stop:1134 length:657 start_codon:yes stop_codon:yes gene_type:complete
MSVKSKFLKNTQNSFQLFSNKKGGGSCNRVGNSVTMTSLNNAANAGMGYSRAVGLPYQHVGGSGYGFDNKAAASSAIFKGSYPSYSSYQKPSQCGGKKRRRKRKTLKKRKRRRMKKSRKGGKRKRSRRRKSKRRRRSRRSRRSRKSRKSRKGGKRKKKSRRKRKTGTLVTLGSPQMGGSTVTYSLGSSNPQKPWALANNSYDLNNKSCFDNYNHFKKN